MRVKDPLLNYTVHLKVCVSKEEAFYVSYNVHVHVAQATIHCRIVEMKIMSIKPIVNWPDTCNKHYKIYALKESDLKIYCNIELDQSLHQK